MKPMYYPAALQIDSEASNQTYPWGIVERDDGSYYFLKNEVFETYLEAEARANELAREAHRAHLSSLR